MHPDCHGLSSAGEGSRDGAAEIVTISIVIFTINIWAAVLLAEGSIGHLHPVIPTAGVGFNIECFKSQIDHTPITCLQNPCLNLEIKVDFGIL